MAPRRVLHARQSGLAIAASAIILIGEGGGVFVKLRCTSSGAEKPFAPFDRTAATCADRPQRQPLTFVARKSWPKSRTKERRLASTRCAENNEQARRLACAAQRVDAAHDIDAAAEKKRLHFPAFFVRHQPRCRPIFDKQRAFGYAAEFG